MLNHKGQALIEYVLIVAIISVITISLVNYFGGYLKDSITKTSCSLVDKEYESGEKPGEGKCVDKKNESNT
ncbi:MAG: Flp family type IVb pilin [Bacilli bacterium]|nr:Flp family type IVb pilin [Bacilli bacterium]